MALELELGFLAFVLLLVILYLVRRHVSEARALADLRVSIQEQAKGLFDSWRNTEIEGIKLQYEDVATQKASALYKQWAVEGEAGFRKDAIQRSMAVVTGKVTEHIAPFLPQFKYNPKDARFIGSPIDLVIFDGYSDGEPKGIIFVEVKTGSSGLSTKERRLRDLIQERVVSWEELHVPVATSPSLGGDDGTTIVSASSTEPNQAKQHLPPIPESRSDNPDAAGGQAQSPRGQTEALWQEMLGEDEGGPEKVTRSDALERMTRALEAGKRARDIGKNVSNVRRNLKQARAAFEKGEYDQAAALADAILRGL